MHYYQFNIGDYIKSTNHLTPEEDITYRRLLDHYYDTESPIPTDNSLVLRKLRLGSIGEKVLVQILSEFFVLTESGWINPRADIEIQAYRAYLNKQKLNGSKGGRPEKPTGNPPVSHTEPKKTLTNNHKPITNNQLLLKPNAPEGAVFVSFDEFWVLYPKKQGKEPARKIWEKLKMDDSLFNQIKTHLLSAYLMTEMQFIPLAKNYLKDKRWMDELLPANHANPPSILKNNNQDFVGKHTDQSWRKPLLKND